MFSRSSNPIELMRIIFHQTGMRKSKMAAIKLEIRISQLVDKIGTRFQRDFNAISTRFQPMFSESINPTKLLRIISHQTGSGKATENTFPPKRRWETNMVKVLIYGTENTIKYNYRHWSNINKSASLFCFISHMLLSILLFSVSSQ